MNVEKAITAALSKLPWAARTVDSLNHWGTSQGSLPGGCGRQGHRQPALRWRWAPFPSCGPPPLGLGPLSGEAPPCPCGVLRQPIDPSLPLSPVAEHSGRKVAGAAAGGGADPATRRDRGAAAVLTALGMAARRPPHTRRLPRHCSHGSGFCWPARSTRGRAESSAAGQVREGPEGLLGGGGKAPGGQREVHAGVAEGPAGHQREMGLMDNWKS